ncbi:MAG: hypothetical protein GY838_19935 [bacterium]|nr:hypothetical protein [bacterium]
MADAQSPSPGLQPVALSVWEWLRSRRFTGYDPYDGLNSRLLASVLPRSRFLRLGVIQAVKRSPVNLRPLLGITPGVNPKGLALIMQGLAKWRQPAGREAAIEELADLIVCRASSPDGSPVHPGRVFHPGLARELATTDEAPPAMGWGYNFAWQSKAFLQPAYYPTVVATNFVVDGFACCGHPASGVVTAGAARFVLEHLHRYRDETGICFSYSPRDRTRVYNASLFAAKILARASMTDTPAAAEMADLATQAADFVVARQRKDGSWIYGEAGHWQWVDNLHTGFVLETLASIGSMLRRDNWIEAVDRGLAYYLANLLTDDDLPRYYAHSTSPLDAHSFAQAALTLHELDNGSGELVDRAGRILGRSVDNLWDEARCGFRFQKGRRFTQRTIFLRWSQAWMFRALATHLGRNRETT